MSDVCPTVRILPAHPSQGDFVEINASDFDEAKGHKRYIAAPPPPPGPKAPPPPPPVPSPLDGLPLKWRDAKPVELKALAERISGRTHENREQAVQTIEAALAARGKY